MKLLLTTFVFLTMATFVSETVRAEALDPAVADALNKTQSVITNPSERAKVIQTDPKAKAATQQVSILAGTPENEQKIYSLASDIFGSLVKETGGDVNKMQALIEEASKNPSAFASKFTPAQLSQLSALAKQIPDPTKNQKLP
jgi:hypothetical protein